MLQMLRILSLGTDAPRAQTDRITSLMYHEEESTDNGENGEDREDGEEKVQDDEDEEDTNSYDSFMSSDDSDNEDEDTNSMNSTLSSESLSSHLHNDRDFDRPLLINNPNTNEGIEERFNWNNVRLNMGLMETDEEPRDEGQVRLIHRPIDVEFPFGNGWLQTSEGQRHFARTMIAMADILRQQLLIERRREYQALFGIMPLGDPEPLTVTHTYAYPPSMQMMSSGVTYSMLLDIERVRRERRERERQNDHHQYLSGRANFTLSLMDHIEAERVRREEEEREFSRSILHLMATSTTTHDSMRAIYERIRTNQHYEDSWMTPEERERQERRDDLWKKRTLHKRALNEQLNYYNGLNTQIDKKRITFTKYTLRTPSSYQRFQYKR